MVFSLLTLATPTMGPPTTSCWPLELELASPCDVPGVWEESDPEGELVPGWPEVAWELELAPNPLLEPPPNPDDCENTPELFTPELPNPELPNAEPPNPELLEAEPFSPVEEPIGFAPGMAPPPMLPSPSVTPGSP